MRVTGKMVNGMGWVWSPEGDGSIEESGPKDSRGGMGFDSPLPRLQNTRGLGPMDFRTAMALKLMLMEEPTKDNGYGV